MNPLLILLTFTVLSSSFAADNSTFTQFEQDLSNFKNNTFGQDNLLQQIGEVGKIVNTLFNITRNDKSSYEQSGDLNYYDFVVQLNDSKQSVIQATLHVEVQGTPDTSQMTYNFQITYTTNKTTEAETESSIQQALNEETDIFAPEISFETDSELLLAQAGQDDQDTQEALDFGVDHVLQIGFNNGKIPNGEDYTITKVKRVNQRSENGRVYYEFDIEVANSQGNIVIEMTFTVRRGSDEEMKVIAFSYKVTKTTTTIRTTSTNGPQIPPVETNFGVPMALPVLAAQTSEQDPDTQEALDFGFQSVLQKGQNRNKINKGEDYQITKINSVNKSFRSNRVIYEFDVEAANSGGNIILTMTFTVRQNLDGEMSVTAYKYHVSKTTSGTDNIGPESVIPSSQYKNPEIQKALAFGRDYVLQLGYKSGKIPNGEDYKVVKINSIMKETGNNAERYKFDITMENSAGNIVIQMNYVVSKNSSGELNIVASAYAIQMTSL